MNKINAKRRNKRPECGANAPTFLSAVYKSGTQAKKRQAGAPQYGRSMIEMLGVLAIIGVLSVGGIMGYSKAMFRYKINKTIEQITYIAGNIRTTFANQGNYAGLNDDSIWKKTHIFPDDMWKDGQNYPQHVWEDAVHIDTAPKNSADSSGEKAFMIDYPNIPEEACIELLTYDWQNAQVKMVEVQNAYNAMLSPGDRDIIPPAAIDNTITLCNTTNNHDVSSIIFFFDIDTNSTPYKEWLEITAEDLANL